VEPVVRTKLGIQARTERLVSRPRLRAILEAAAPARLVLVAAPAGFGKTSLLADWMVGSETAFAWLSLDAADNDPARFVRYLRAAMAGDGPAPQRAPDRELVLAELVDAVVAVNGPFALVLDDYHLIEAAPVHSIVAELLDRLPPNGRLVIATRADPPLRLARLRARGELIEVRAEDLRFTTAEADALLRGPLGLELSIADVEQLAARTEGWVAALQLAGLSLRGRADASRIVREFGASNRFVLDFVVDEVLGSLSAATQDFLLRTSVAARLCGPLCDALTGDRDGQDRLESLERANLLLFPLDQERRWYRYHHLLADLLRGRLAATDPGLSSELHGRAADWLERHGAVDDAVEQAQRGGDPARVIRLVRANWMAIMHGGELWTVQRWLDALPAELVQCDPQLSATYAWGLVLRGDATGVEARLDDAEHALQSGSVATLDRRLVPAQLELIRAKLSEIRHDFEAERRHAKLAIERIPAGVGPVFDALLRGDATSLMAQAELLAGDDVAAAAAFGRSVPLLRRGGNHIGVAHAARELARIELRAGRPRQALERCDAELATAGDAADVVVAYGAVHLARAEALLALGDRAGARAAAVRADAVARAGGEGPVVRGATALIAGLDAEPGRATNGTRALRGESLTPRELEVLRLVAIGRSNRQIAAELFVTVGTVKTHVHAISGKLAAANRVEAIARAREAGLLA